MTTTQSDHGTNKHFYDRISSFYDHIADANEHTARETGERMLALRSGERVVEIGFGTGNSLLDLARAVGEDGHVGGLDVSEGMRDVAKKSSTPPGLPIGWNCVLGMRFRWIGPTTRSMPPS